MAFELYGMLAGNVSPMTGENVKPAYGGEEEAFLKKVVTPIYVVIARVLFALFYFCQFPQGHWISADLYPFQLCFGCHTPFSFGHLMHKTITIGASLTGSW